MRDVNEEIRGRGQTQKGRGLKKHLCLRKIPQWNWGKGGKCQRYKPKGGKNFVGRQSFRTRKEDVVVPMPKKKK